MPYSTNPHLPKVRASAVKLVRGEGWSVRQTARYIGVQPGTVSKWLKKCPSGVGRIHVVPTKSSRPKNSPNAIDKEIVDRIIAIRLKRGRCAQVIHAQLKREEVHVSLSTVKRTLDRQGLTKKRGKWKKYHAPEERPKAKKPGILVQMDTIHLLERLNCKKRIYIFTMIDCFSRWGYARAADKASTINAVKVMRLAQRQAPFQFSCIQSDHGPEFMNYFTGKVKELGLRHRHSRVRMPNDNAHVERFNRTIQEECRKPIIKYRTDLNKLNREIMKYMRYYNNERLHMGLGFKTPSEACQMFPRS